MSTAWADDWCSGFRSVMQRSTIAKFPDNVSSASLAAPGIDNDHASNLSPALKMMWISLRPLTDCEWNDGGV